MSERRDRWLNQTHQGDCRELMPQMIADGVQVQMCVTSPPYWRLRDYGDRRQIGLESSPAEYVAQLVNVFRLVRELMTTDGTLWLVLGDCYALQGAPGHSGLAALGTRYAGGGHKHDVIQKPRRSIASGMKRKDLMGLPWMVAFALRADGWYLRSDIVWHKPNPMPESVRDRPTRSHEFVFLLSKSARYYYDADRIKEPAVYGRPNSPQSIRSPYGQGFTRANKTDLRHHRPSHKIAPVIRSSRKPLRSGVESRHRTSIDGGQSLEACPNGWRNKRSVWTVATTPCYQNHFATFPRKLIEPCILAGSRIDDIVLDPFMGSGTTRQMAVELGRHYIGCELNPSYIAIEQRRCAMARLRRPG